MTRIMNFNAGPATLPLAALETAQRELLDFRETGMSVMEHSHRGAAYAAVHEETLDLLRRLLALPDDYEVLLLQGGASQQFALVPMNLLKPSATGAYAVTGSWSKKALAEAKITSALLSASVSQAVSTQTEDGKFPRVPRPEEVPVDPQQTYLHITSNNTIAGTQWFDYPDAGDVPLVADMSSDLLFRPLDVKPFGLIYAGAQKNVGPSGVTIVIARRSLIDQGREDIPKIFQYRTHADAKSLSNTPPTFAVYMVRNVLLGLLEAGGLAEQERRNREKAAVLYGAIDARPDFYRCPVEAGSRSLMNVVFNLPTPELEARFVKEAAARGMVGLKGHRSVGGIRASIYNAAPRLWCEQLAAFMQDFKG